MGVGDSSMMVGSPVCGGGVAAIWLFGWGPGGAVRGRGVASSLNVSLFGGVAGRPANAPAVMAATAATGAMLMAAKSFKDLNDFND
jgi:hypothetical protein